MASNINLRDGAGNHCFRSPIIQNAVCHSRHLDLTQTMERSATGSLITAQLGPLSIPRRSYPPGAEPIIAGKCRHPHSLMSDARYDNPAPTAGHSELCGFRLSVANG